MRDGKEGRPSSEARPPGAAECQWPHLYLLAGDLRGAGGPGRGVEVALTHYVLEQVDQQGAGVCTAVHVHHVVGATQFEQRLALGTARDGEWGTISPGFIPATHG